jgi:hypothetical protein
MGISRRLSKPTLLADLVMRLWFKSPLVLRGPGKLFQAYVAYISVFLFSDRLAGLSIRALT